MNAAGLVRRDGLPQRRPVTVYMTRLAAVVCVLGWATGAWAQTAEEIVNKSIAALGGREAHGKLKSRTMTGTIALSTPGGDVSGTVELTGAAPNKSRQLLKVDLTALGAGPMTFDQRFDGKTGYVIDTLQGNRDITGNQLDNLRNNSFPHPYLGYKDIGTTIKLIGKDKVGDREVLVVEFDPTSGSSSRNFIDAETFLPIQVVTKIEVPQLGNEQVEYITQFLDYKDVDGVKVPFQLKTTSAIQNFTITISKVEHNVTVDNAIFVKPAQ